MKHDCIAARPVLVALAVAAAGMACSSGGGHTSGDAGGSGVSLTNRMNYAFHSSLAATTTPVRANSDLSFNWSAVSRDMLGRQMDPFADVDMLQLMLWRYDKASFLASIDKEELKTGRLVALGYCATEKVRDSCRLLDLVGPGGGTIPQPQLLSYVDPETYPPSNHVWVIMLATGNVLGQGTRLLAFFQPGEGESDTEVRLTNDSTTLDYAAKLTELAPIPLPQHDADIVVSWADDAQLTMNAMGAAWVPTRITDVAVAHYVGLTVADLEEQFLLLRELASEYYGARLEVGQEVRLSDLADEHGNPFRGIDDSGIWLFSLTCGSCRNPAPWFLSVMRPT